MGAIALEWMGTWLRLSRPQAEPERGWFCAHGCAGGGHRLSIEAAVLFEDSAAPIQQLPGGLSRKPQLFSRVGQVELGEGRDPCTHAFSDPWETPSPGPTVVRVPIPHPTPAAR